MGVQCTVRHVVAYVGTRVLHTVEQKMSSILYPVVWYHTTSTPISCEEPTTGSDIDVEFDWDSVNSV